jgi:hypothetical protein
MSDKTDTLNYRHAAQKVDNAVKMANKRCFKDSAKNVLL